MRRFISWTYWRRRGLTNKASHELDLSHTIFSESESKKMSFRKNRFKKSINNSFDLNLANKIASSDEDTSDHDSWSSVKTDNNIGRKHVSSF